MRIHPDLRERALKQHPTSNVISVGDGGAPCDCCSDVGRCVRFATARCQPPAYLRRSTALDRAQAATRPRSPRRAPARGVVIAISRDANARSDPSLGPRPSSPRTDHPIRSRDRLSSCPRVFERDAGDGSEEIDPRRWYAEEDKLVVLHRTYLLDQSRRGAVAGESARDRIEVRGVVPIRRSRSFVYRGSAWTPRPIISTTRYSAPDLSRSVSKSNRRVVRPVLARSAARVLHQLDDRLEFQARIDVPPVLQLVLLEARGLPEDHLACTASSPRFG